jgi:hypothetical protein
VVNAEAVIYQKKGVSYIKRHNLTLNNLNLKRNLYLNIASLEKKIIKKTRGNHSCASLKRAKSTCLYSDISSDDFRKAIKQYIQKRKVEIITELETYYQLLMAKLSPMAAASSLPQVSHSHKGEL